MKFDILEIRKQNLRKIIDEQFGGSVNAFAKYVQRPSGFFYDVFNSKRPLGERIMRSLETALGIIPHELDQENKEEGFKERKIELINVYSLKFSPGNDEIFDEKPITQALISRQLIIKNGWDINYLCCFDLPGPSMEPTLRIGSRILVNTRQEEVVDNKIFAFKKGNEIFIKRFYKVFNEDKIIAKADNPLYPEFQINLAEEKSDFKIIGMAVLRLEEYL